MPLFYFNMRDGGDYIEDFEGMDLDDLESAHREAIISARELLSDRVKRGAIIGGQQFEITDEAGVRQAVIPFKEAFNFPK